MLYTGGSFLNHISLKVINISHVKFINFNIGTSFYMEIPITVVERRNPHFSSNLISNDSVDTEDNCLFATTEAYF